MAPTRRTRRMTWDSDAEGSSGESGPEGSIFDPLTTAILDLESTGSDSGAAGKEHKQKYKSGAAKKRRRKDLMSQRASGNSLAPDLEQMATGAVHNHSDAEEAEEAPKLKQCGLCKCKSTDPDPIGLRLAVPGQRKRTVFMRWERKGACCYYCARVHERRYGHISRKQLKEDLQNTIDEGDQSEVCTFDEFMAAREKAIEFLETHERLPPEFKSMVVVPGKQVKSTKAKFEKATRRGKKYRLDVFKKLFPEADPTKKGVIYDRTDTKGHISKWVKVYNDDDGIEDFSEGDEDRVQEEHLVDDGSLVFDDNQIRDAFDHTTKAQLTMSAHAGFTRTDLGLASSSAPTAPTVGNTPKKKAPKSVQDINSEDSSDDEDVAPLDRAMGKKPAPSKRKGAEQKSAKSIRQAEQAARLLVEKSKSFLQKFRVSEATASEDWFATFQKFGLECKRLDSKILIKAGKLELAQSVSSTIEQITTVLDFLKAYAGWNKAMIEGRADNNKKTKQDSKGPVGKLKDAWSNIVSASVKLPTWAVACRHTVRVGEMCAELKYKAALDLITTSKVGEELQVNAQAAAPWIEEWASDIMLAAMKGNEVAQARAELEAVLNTLQQDMYEATEGLLNKCALLSKLLRPERYSTEDVAAAVGSLRSLRSGKSAFWMIACSQASMKQLLEDTQTCQNSRAKEEEHNKALGSILTASQNIQRNLVGDSPDFVQYLDVLKEMSRSLVTCVQSIAGDSLAVEFVKNMSTTILVPILQALAASWVMLDQKYLSAKWCELVFDVKLWTSGDIGIVESLMVRHTAAKDDILRLEAIEIGSVMKGNLLKQELFVHEGFCGLTGSMEFREQHLYLMSCFKNLSDAMSATSAESQKALPMPADVLAKFEHVCSAKVKFEQLLLAAGAPSCVPEGLDVNKCIESIVDPTIKSLGRRVLDEKMSPFLASLVSSNYPPGDRDKLLPSGATDDDLIRIASAETSLGQTLAHVLASLGMSDELKVLETQRAISSLQSASARVLLELHRLPPSSAINASNLALQPTLFVAMKSMDNALGIASDNLKLSPEVKNQAWSSCESIASMAKQFWAEKLSEVEGRLVSMMRCAEKSLKTLIPEWREYTLVTPNAGEIKTKLIDSDGGAKLASLYPACAALHNDLNTYDTELRMSMKLKHGPALKALDNVIYEAKLFLSVQHAVNIIYVTGPKVKGAKAKAGLIREFQRRVKAAGVTMPSELMVQVKSI